MSRILPFHQRRAHHALVAMLLMAASAWAQVPPGFPYKADEHPNPILTFVTNQDFKPSTSADAQKLTGLDLLGLSKEEGRQDSVEVAVIPATNRKVKLRGGTIDVVFYSVVKQTFTLAGGGSVILHSSKFPRLPVPLKEAAPVLNQSAFAKAKPSEARFGSATAEMIDVRGQEALLFDDGMRRTIFWVERGIIYTATSSIRQSQLIRIIEDLL
jgi:hypothetical protein